MTGPSRSVSLRLRLGLGIGIVVAVSVAILGFAVVSSTQATLVDGLRGQLTRSVRDRASAALPRPGQGRDQTTDPRGLRTAHLAYSSTDQLIIAESAGPPSDPKPLPDLSADDVARLRSGAELRVRAVRGDLTYLVLGAVLADGRLEIEAAPLDDVHDTISTLVTRFVIGALLMLVFAVVAVVLVLRHGLRPLRDVIVTADAVASGEREQRIPTDRGPTEIRHLSAALDRMVQEQRSLLTAREASEARLRQFIGDASHELQTPITSVLGWTELRRKGALDAAGEAAAMTRIEAESRRMSRLVEDLSLLARLDDHRHDVIRAVEPVDLAAVASDAVADALAVEPGRLLSLRTTGAVTVRGDASRLRQVIDNLLRNVRVHTPAATPADVAVSGDGREVTLTVRDRGPGIPPDQAPHVFDRFWRSDRSRARATGGSGLGLAITHAIVVDHGGTISVANHPEGGAVFTVRFPSSAVSSTRSAPTNPPGSPR